MQNQWTGGQYSVFRALLGLVLLWSFIGKSHEPEPLTLALTLLESWSGPGLVLLFQAVGAAAAVLLVLGQWDRVAAWLLFFLVPLQAPDAGLLMPLFHPYPFLLVIHLMLAKKPYGSLAAAGRPDPGENWRLPAGHYGAAWLLMLAMFAGSLTRALSEGTNLQATLCAAAGLAAGLLILKAGLRPLAWLLLAGLFPVYSMLGLQSLFVPYLLLHLLCFDPAWLPARVGDKEYLFYDGDCGLCHRACRFVLAEDRDGLLFTMAPLQGDLFKSKVSEATRSNLPDSLVLLTSDGRVLTRSNAVLVLGLRLGGIWRPLAGLTLMIPRVLRDGAYSMVAAVRHRLFKKPDNACPVVPMHLRSRFDW